MGAWDTRPYCPCKFSQCGQFVMRRTWKVNSEDRGVPCVSNRTHAVPHPLRGTCLQNELLVSSGAIWKALWHVAGLVPVHRRYPAHSPQPQRLRGVPIPALGRSGLEPFEHGFVFMRVFLSTHTSPLNSASAQRPSGFPPPACDLHGQRPRAGNGTLPVAGSNAVEDGVTKTEQNCLVFAEPSRTGAVGWFFASKSFGLTFLGFSTSVKARLPPEAGLRLRVKGTPAASHVGLKVAAGSEAPHHGTE